MNPNSSISQPTTEPTIGDRTPTRQRRIRKIVAAGAAAMALLVVYATFATASPASGVVPTLLARGTFDSFKVASYPDSAGLFKAEAKRPLDVVVRRHDYAVGGSTGWHQHPYPVLITVISGELTFYAYDDPNCTPIVVRAGEGYVDNGRGHIGRNESDAPAVDVSVIMAPVGAPFRAELTAPGPYCGF